MPESINDQRGYEVWLTRFANDAAAVGELCVSAAPEAGGGPAPDLATLPPPAPHVGVREDRFAPHVGDQGSVLLGGSANDFILVQE